MYNVVYLPIARQDLDDAALYIAAELHAPDAALALLDAIEQAVAALREMPYRHALYASLYALKHEVRCFPIKNYNVFYVVDEARKTVEIWRVLYQRRRMGSI